MFESADDAGERVPAYATPQQLVRVASFGETWAWENHGVRPTRRARFILNTAARMTGFERFLEQLPDRLPEAVAGQTVRPATCGPLDAATMVLADDHRTVDPIARAVTLVLAGVELRNDIVSGALPQDQVHGLPVEMFQYSNLFGMNLDLAGNRWRRSDRPHHLGVLYRGAMFVIELDAACGQTSEHVAADLQAVVSGTVPTKCDGRTLLSSVSTAMRLRLLSTMPAADVPPLLFTICLDFDTGPANHAEAGRLAQIGNCENRWYASSMQVVVFGNAMAAVLCSFSADLDGNVMMRAADELQRRASHVPIAGLPVRRAGSRVPVNLPAITAEDVARARSHVRTLTSAQESVFWLDGLGSEYFARLRVQPVPAFVVALHGAVHTIAARPADIRQYVSQATYRGMRVRQMSTLTDTVAAVCRVLHRGDHPRELAVLFRKAVAENQERSRVARRHFATSVAKQIYRMSTADGARRRHDRIDRSALWLAGRLGCAREPDPWSIVLSHPRIFPTVPLVGRPGVQWPGNRVGIHYQIREQGTTLVISGPADLPNEGLARAVDAVCRRIGGALVADPRAVSPSQVE